MCLKYCLIKATESHWCLQSMSEPQFIANAVVAQAQLRGAELTIYGSMYNRFKGTNSNCFIFQDFDL